jgi:hypothetical protein
MSRYLVVAHQTADSSELAAALGDRTRNDPATSVVLLVPATPVHHLASWTAGEARAVAAQAGEQGRQVLERAGVTVDDVIVGDPNPIYAVGDELGERDYEGIVVSTLARGASRWLRVDVVRRLERLTGLPVTHVEAAAPEKPRSRR